MATTDQPQDPDAETTPLAPSVEAGYPAEPAAPPPQAGPPATSGSGARVAIIVGSIVGGLLLIALAFGGGAAVGWTLGSHHAGMVASGEHRGPGGGMPGQGHGDRGHDQRGPGQRPDDRERNAPDDEVTPAPTPDS